MDRRLGYVLPLLLASCASAPARRSDVKAAPEAPATSTSFPPGMSAPVVPAACRGARLTFGAELDACACYEHEVRVGVDGTRSVVAGVWCGPPMAVETSSVEVTLAAEPSVVESGKATSVRMRVRNPSDEAVLLRFPKTNLFARVARPDGAPLDDEAFSSGATRNEALVELDPHGTMEITFPVVASYARHVGAPEVNEIRQTAVPPGPYAVRVFLGGFAGIASKLVPIEVR